MTITNYIGYGLLSLPFVGVFGILMAIDWRAAVFTFGLTGALFATVFAGFYLANK